MKNLYVESYKILNKEIKYDSKTLKDIPCSWIGRIIIVKMAKLPKANYRLHESLSNHPWHFFTELKQTTKIYREP